MARRYICSYHHKSRLESFDEILNVDLSSSPYAGELYYVELLEDMIMKEIQVKGKLQKVDYVRAFIKALPIVKIQHFAQECPLSTPSRLADNEVHYVKKLPDTSEPDYQFSLIYDVSLRKWVELSRSEMLEHLVAQCAKQYATSVKAIYEFISLFNSVPIYDEDFVQPVIQEYPIFKVTKRKGAFNLLVYTNTKAYSLVKKKFYDLKPSMLITSKLRYDLPQTMKTPDKISKEIDTFFNDLSSGDHKMKKALIQLCICAVLDYCPNKEMFILYGGAGTGKSTFLNVLLALFGKHNAVSIPINALDNDAHLAKIGLARLIYSFDNDSNTNLYNNGRIKSIIMRELFSYNRKFKSPETNQFTGFVVQALNSMPKLPTDETDAMNDRIFLIHFKNVFRNTSKEKADYAASLTTSEMMPYLMAYLLTSEFMTHFEKVERIQAHEELKLDLVDSQNSVTVFARKVLPEVLANDALISSHLYSLYVDFNADFNAGGRPFSQRKFEQLIAKPLSALGYIDSSDEKNQHPFRLRFNRLKNLGLYDEQTLVDAIECETKHLSMIIHSHSTDKKNVQLKYFYRTDDESRQYDITKKDIQSFDLNDKQFQIKLARFLMKVYAKALDESNTQLLALSEQYREAQSSADNKQLQKLLNMMYDLF